jgi:dipeptidyl aminopeptidase/acylaminoacyl peptidase
LKKQNSKPINKRIKYLLVVIILGAAVYIAASVISVNNFLSAKKVEVIFPDTLSLEHKDIQFKTSDNLTIKGWYFPAGSSDKAVILCHGWTANRYETLPRVKILVESGYNVLTYDSRACGESEGDLISLGYYEANDLLAAIDYLKSLGIQKIAADGISQGGATIVFASEKSNHLNCIIIESCFDELRNAVNNRFSSMLYIPGAIGSALMIPLAKNKLGVSVDEIAPVNKIKNIHIPLFIISGEADTRTTPEETKKLFDTANEPKRMWLVPAAGHIDLYRVNTAEYEKRILEFLKFMDN